MMCGIPISSVIKRTLEEEVRRRKKEEIRIGGGWLKLKLPSKRSRKRRLLKP